MDDNTSKDQGGSKSLDSRAGSVTNATDTLIVTLMQFYNVRTIELLIAAQAYHIERLQESLRWLQPLKDTQPRNPREG